ncbi:hypothetical protein [Psychrobacter sp. FDAARGOS_221]|uniref:hypothetical protein n=1 Tax=Psychrobacter sp. FDAARGOS_221 TaxID=1975705 RepID=UPI000BB54CDF|nr:hypothetical protein [Psychrobacter sp. FDAARGOS_221]PNK60951.1 hypothetical protein A6J60_008710 [Psychrobacter sp. FDAARGOS_221]
MLQVTDTGANITLSGKASGYGDGVFWFGVALLIGAIGVAMAMSLLPERLAIGALAVLIIGSFIFNVMRNKQKNAGHGEISSGILKVQHGMFVHNMFGKTQTISVQADDNIELSNSALTITDANGNRKCHITGFDSDKEAQVMKAILQGQQFGKRNANIKMQSS